MKNKKYVRSNQPLCRLSKRQLVNTILRQNQQIRVLRDALSLKLCDDESLDIDFDEDMSESFPTFPNRSDIEPKGYT
jgi:hypothetical protein